MSELQPQYDAILVHGYWFSEGDGPVEPSLRSRVAAVAGAKLFLEEVKACGDKQIPGPLVLGIGQIWGPNITDNNLAAFSELTLF